jgi:histidine ammonia-lyase
LDPIVLDGETLSATSLLAIGHGAPAALGDAARARMLSSVAWYEAQGRSVLASKIRWLTLGKPASDGVGDVDWVRGFVVSHCSGVGDPLPLPWVRAMIAARVNVLATGYSACRPEIAEVLLEMLAAGVTPVVPSQGSVGAAGDLAPLAHVVRVACGFGGEAWRGGRRMPAAEAMAGLRRLEPREKEALSLINGATLTAALGGVAIARARLLLETAEAATALSFEVCQADTACVAEAPLAARRHPGAVTSAERIRKLLAGSDLVGQRGEADAFSIRCAPAVLGAAREAIDAIQATVERELNGACDNPLVFADEGILEAGNFHGAPVAMAMDHLKIALTQVAGISERRTFRMTTGALTGLPSFLVADTGLDSGLMIAQYTAASLVSACKGLSHPASVDSIPTVQHHEDHVSMGPIAARTALEVTEHVADVLAVELLVAAQGLDWRKDAGGTAAPGTAAIFDLVRGCSPRWTRDRVLHPDLAAVSAAVRAGAFATGGAW